MSRYLVILCFTVSSAVSIPSAAQLRTITASGDWNDPGIWLGGIIATSLSEDVLMQNGTSVTVPIGQSFIVGGITANNNNTVSVAAGGSLQLGDPGTPAGGSLGNNGVINVAGDLIVYGSLTVDNNLVINVTGVGEFTVHGDITMNNNATVDVNGEMNVEGDFNGGSNTSVNVDGVINVGGDVNMGANSELTGDGEFNLAGDCTGPPGFCDSPTLPILLVSFSARVHGNSVVIDWVTEEEVNVSHYTIQRSREGKEFADIGDVAPSTEKHLRNHYSFVDRDPLEGVSYYRLKETDLDGAFYLFKIEKVFVSKTAGITIHPNPVVDGQLTLSVRQNGQAEYQVNVSDMAGRVVQLLFSSQPELTIPFDHAPGMYIVRFQSPDFSHFERILKK